MRKSIVAMAVVLVWACGSDPTGPGTPIVSVVGDTTFVELPIGASVSVADISLGFGSVPEDSRCPFGVTCVWAGTASVELSLSDSASIELDTLSTTTAPMEVDFSGHRISLRALAPYPVYGRPRDPDDYVAHLAVFEVP